MHRVPQQVPVIVVGSVNVDHLLVTERLPARGGTIKAIELRHQHGGKGANQAVAAARAQAPSGLIACVGSDHEGSDALDHLKARGVKVDRIARTERAMTGLATVITSRTERDNKIIVGLGANACLDSHTVIAGIEHVLRANTTRCCW